jgi:DNA replication protein DnaC
MKPLERSPDDLLKGLNRLGLRASADALRALLTHLTKSRASPAECFEQLTALERRERDARNLARRTKSATLGSYKALDNFDWNHPRSIDRALFEELLELRFLDTGENVLFRGQSGVGKTNLSQNLGLRALERGRTVRFSTLAQAVADLSRQESTPALERRLRRYTNVDLLILDELGYLPCDSRSADLIYTIISRRHEQRSTIVTTNLAYKLWGTVFPGAACVVALVDRFAQHCHVIDIDAESWRNNDPGRASRTSSRARPPARDAAP